MYSVLSFYLNIPTKYSLLAIYKCSFKTVWPSVQTCSKNCLAICTCSKTILPNNHVPKKLPGHLYSVYAPTPWPSEQCTYYYSLAICTCSYQSPWPSVHVPTHWPFLHVPMYKSPCSSVDVPTKVPGHLYMFLLKYLAICTCSYCNPWSSVHVTTKVPGHLYMFLLSSLAICTCSY